MDIKKMRHPIDSSKWFHVILFLAFLLSGCAAEAIQPMEPPSAGETTSEEPTTGSPQEGASAIEQKRASEPTAEPTSEPVAIPLAIINGVLIDGTGTDPITNQVVLIDNGLISAVGPAEEIEIPKGITTIDAQGGTILPGIVEGRASDLLNELRLEDGVINPFDAEVYLYRTLRGGVTTLRATGWEWQAQQNLPAFRAALDEMGNTIPTMVISGTGIAHVDGAGVTQYYADQLVGVRDIEEARQITEKLLELGADQVGVSMAVGPEIRSGRELPILNPEQLQAIVETAHSYDRPVIAQAIFADEVEMVAEAGVDQLLNWPHLQEPMPEEMIASLVSASIPVLSGFNIERPLEGDVRRFLDAGGTLVYGTFAPNAGPLNAPFNEFQRMALVGDMTPMEIIMAATADAAEAVGLGEQIGTLEVGKTADIIIVDGDPLEDLRVFRDGVTVVIKGGELVDLDS